MNTINQARVTDIAERFSAMTPDCGREKIDVHVFFSSGQRIVVCGKSMLSENQSIGRDRWQTGRKSYATAHLAALSAGRN
jgi:hypothetical protein